MSEYFVPTGPGEGELVEKRSRFLSRVCSVETEAEARAYLEQVKKLHHDARHHCWCYRLREGGERCSDDGEPQGTAGQPILNVFQREQVENVLCVVTRYFGGVLLGAGGLTRAYGSAAKLALDAAGTSVVRRWLALSFHCPYPLFERVKQELAQAGGTVAGVEYADHITMQVLLLDGKEKDFTDRMVELTAGGSVPKLTGEVLKPAPKGREV